MILDRSFTRAVRNSGIGLFVLALWVFAPPAHAGHKVYSPVVHEGEWEIEARGHLDIDGEDSLDGGQKQIYEVGYGVTDIWSTALLVELEKDPGGPLKYDSIAWENIIEFFGQEEAWLGSGLYLEFEAKDEDGKADKIETKLLLERDLTGITNTANLVFEKEVGNNADDDVEFGYAWRSRAKVMEHLKLGFEAFGELGEINNFKSPDRQEHQIGPMLYGGIELTEDVELEYRLGVLFGLTDATPDETFVWQLELEF
jgi:hypothetical protein